MRKLCNYIFLCSIFLCLQSCHSKKSKISTTVFEVENIGDKEIPFTYYKTKGFHLTYEDVTIFEKKRNDTLVQLYIDDELNTINMKIWKIKLNWQKKEDLGNWFLKHNVFFIEPMMMTHRKNLADFKYFSVIKQIDNTVFTCRINQEYGIDYLFIEYHYPLQGKNLKKSIERYERDSMGQIYDETKAHEEETKMLYEK